MDPSLKERLVLRVNELHHDLEEAEYGEVNERMFGSEWQRWKECFNLHFCKKMRIMKLGVGTGFVPRVFLESRAAKRGSTYICTDISQGILDRCRKNLGKSYPFKFKKLSSEKGRPLPFADGSLDAIIMNSVLHHLPDVDFFFTDARRALKKGGLLVIGHEPNRKFYRHLFTAGIYKTLFMTAQTIGRIRNIGKKHQRSEVNEKINNVLLKEKLVTSPLTDGEISGLVDHYATTGFDIKKLGIEHGFRTVRIETYNYLLSLSFNYPNLLFRCYEWLLSRLLKERGGLFFATFEA